MGANLSEKAVVVEDVELASTSHQSERVTAAEGLPRVVGRIGEQIGELSVNVADMSGTVSDVSADMQDQLMTLEEVVNSVEHVATQNTQIAELVSETNEIAKRVSDGLETTVTSIDSVFSKSSSDIQSMARSSEQSVAEFGDVKSKLDQVYNFSQSITKISSETQFLAINAGILAANTGEAGKGFAVIAESIRELAQETSEVSKNIMSQLDTLKHTVDSLVAGTQASNEKAVEAVERTGEIETQIARFRDFGTEVSSMANNIQEISGPVERNSEICSQVAARSRTLNRESRENTVALNETSRKFDKLVSFSEEMVLLVEQSGVETKDTPIIKACSAAAREIEALFEAKVSSGAITMAELFDEKYKEVPGSDPVQHMTAFTQFTDSVLPEIQERMKEAHPRIVFCAAVDRNGYLPTHNVVYSHPQSSDPVWNAANCRNRRIFDDRTGAAAGANTKPFLMQTYRRDMGGGKFSLMKDLSVPINVRGKHWGGLRMGVEV